MAGIHASGQLNIHDVFEFSVAFEVLSFKITLNNNENQANVILIMFSGYCVDHDRMCDL